MSSISGHTSDGANVDNKGTEVAQHSVLSHPRLQGVTAVQFPVFLLAMAWLFLDPADYAKCVSQHEQEAGNAEYIHFCYLANWGIPEATPRQRHTSVDAGTAKLSLC